MNLHQALLAAACVAAMSLGQLLFKRAGIELQVSQTWFAPKTLGFTWAAFVVSGLSMLFWISLLRHVPLSRAHPFMALSFCIVPLTSMLLFRESLTPAYLGGLALVLAGLGVIVRFG